MSNVANPHSMSGALRRRRASLACAAVISSALLGAPLACEAAAAAGHSSRSNSAVSDFTGIWIRQGSFLFDPAVRDPLQLKPPYKADWMKSFDDYRQGVVKSGVSKLDPTAGCLPPGMPRMMSAVYPMEILLTPGQVTIITEWMEQIRRVFTDGRKHPDDPDITYVGHSIGHWEQGALVIDTVAMNADTLLDQSGMRHSADIHVMEHMRLIDHDTLQNELTLEDPVAFTHPWTVTRTFKRAKPGEEMREYVCMENNRNPIKPDGTVGTILQGDGAK